MKKKKKKKKKKMNTRKEKEEGGKRAREALAGRIRFVNGLSADDKVIRAVHHGHRVHGPQKKSDIYSDRPVETVCAERTF